jgi:hypothetical protein
MKNDGQNQPSPRSDRKIVSETTVEEEVRAEAAKKSSGNLGGGGDGLGRAR